MVCTVNMHQSLRHKKHKFKKTTNFGSFSYFQASLWLGVDKVLQKLTKSYKLELRYLFQCCILTPRKCPRKNPFPHTVPPLKSADVYYGRPLGAPQMLNGENFSTCSSFHFPISTYYSVYKPYTSVYIVCNMYVS